jgi:putative FmdB family regulatory protein
MPIYEFYCPDCHMVFSFFSRKVNTAARPPCPKCRRGALEREVSLFAAPGRAREDAGDGAGADLPGDEGKMERALSSLAGEAESLNEDDPRQAAQLMRKFSRMTGMELGEGMRTALERMEAGEDPEQVEQEMGDALEQDEPFVLPEKGGPAGRARGRRGAPRRDPTLHDL